jgi:hypothetical protein
MELQKGGFLLVWKDFYIIIFLIYHIWLPLTTSYFDMSNNIWLEN